MKRKIMAMTMVLAMAVSMMAGCKGTTSSNSGVQEITWMFWDDVDATTDLVSIGYKEVVDRFNEDYKGTYHVNIETTNLEEYDAKLNAKIAGKKCPDVYICNPGPNLTTYVENGAAADLTQLLTVDNKEWYDTFTSGIFERMTYDGKIMAVPTCFTAACVFYNTEIFETAGATVPTTWDEFLATCQKIKDAGYTPISCSAGTPWCLSMIAGYLCDRVGGAEILASVNNGTGHWTDKGFIDATAKLKDLSQYFQSTCAGDSNDQATAAFYNGEAAMLVQGSWVIGQINGANADMEAKCGVFQFPSITGGADPNRMIVKTDNLVMSSTTKYPEACIALMKYFTDETAQKYIAEVGGKMPIIDCDIDYEKAPKQLSYVMDILKNMTGTLGFYNESFSTVECGDIYDNAMVDIVLGNKTNEEALQVIEDYYKDNVWAK